MQNVIIDRPDRLSGNSGRKLLDAQRIRVNVQMPDGSTKTKKVMDLRALRTPAIVNNVTGKITNNALLTAEEWIDIDERIIPLAQYEMTAVMDLVDHGLVHRLGGIGDTISRWMTQGDRLPATVAMEPSAQGHRDLVSFEYEEVPIPVIYSDVEMGIRMLEATRRMGTDVDKTNFDAAAREVGIACEKILLHGYSSNFLGKSIYGYTTHPNRITVSGFDTTPFNTATHPSGGTNAEAMILALIREARMNHFRGPFMLYIPAGYDTELYRRFDNGNSAMPTLDSWLQTINRIEAIKENDLLEDGNMILVNMQSDTVDWAEGFPLAPIEWESMGGMVEITRILTAGAPRLKSRQDGKMGIIHLRFQAA